MSDTKSIPQIIAGAVSHEEMVIGDLKKKFLRSDVHAQRNVGISPSECVGNICLAYYRGKAVAREEMMDELISKLEGKYPAAASFLRQQYKNK